MPFFWINVFFLKKKTIFLLIKILLSNTILIFFLLKLHNTMLANPIFAKWRTFVIWTTLVNKKFCYKNRASWVEWKLASVLRSTRPLFNIRAYSCATATLRPNDIIQIRILHVSNVCERWGVSIIHCIDREDWYILLPFRDIILHNKLCVHSTFWCLEIIFTNMIDIE